MFIGGAGSRYGFAVRQAFGGIRATVAEPAASVRDEPGIGSRRGLDRARKVSCPEMSGMDRRQVLGAAAAVAGAVGLGAAVVSGCR